MESRERKKRLKERQWDGYMCIRLYISVNISYT